MNRVALVLLLALASSGPGIVSGILAAPVIAASNCGNGNGPSVSIPDGTGTVVGSSSDGVDTFKGIPYAQPPLGDLRLRPPRRLTKSFGTLNATGIPRACPQLTNPIYVGEGVSEDCLTLNINRPSTATAESKLPVLLYIYGGGFQIGSTQSFDGGRLVQRSIALSRDVIFVAVNYRLGGFGFLAGRQLQAEGSTNLGLRDQRLGMQWVADNIAAFGGDPDKVTIWGESAGAVSVYDHTIIEKGNHTYKGKPLFRGAIMNSGSMGPGVPVNHPKPQAIFDTVARNAGCGSNSSDVLACLRRASYTNFLTASNSVPSIFSYRSIDISYLPRPDPSSTFFPMSQYAALFGGFFARVPVIIGNQEDEGTMFAQMQANLTTTFHLTDYMASYFPDLDHSVVERFVASYPDSPAAGSPYNTGTSWNIYPQYKRLAAILGDYFTLIRRVYLTGVTAGGAENGAPPAWSYLTTNLRALPTMGTYHSSELPGLFNPTLGLPIMPTLNYYIAFVNTLNPNSVDSPETKTWWPTWTGCNRTMINFSGGGVAKTMADDFRPDQFTQWEANLFRLEV